MRQSNKDASSTNATQKKYRGVRSRKWGKWVSEIRVPGTQERLWLGTYTTAEAAAVAHDVAFYYLRETSKLSDFNFPAILPTGTRRSMSPGSVQRTATDAGMAIDAHLISQPRVANNDGYSSGGSSLESAELNISVYDYDWSEEVKMPSRFCSHYEDGIARYES